MKQTLLENSDALVLLSIIYASEFGSKNVDIGNIIASFDYIEHAIITYEELNGALCRLSENSYISEVKELEFLPSVIIINAFNKKKINNMRINFRNELEFIRELINAKEWDNNFNFIVENENYNFKGFENVKYELACKNYIKT
jgi:hypothetical protein